VLADGNIELLGRADSQVKIRGFRVDLAEIESAVRAQESVREAIAVMRDNGAMLALYAVAADGAALEPAAMRRALRARLPDYMVPAEVVVVDALPRLPNGKVDVQRLPDPVIAAPASAQARDMTPSERLISGMWSELLGGRAIDPHENFFDIGGHSLMVIQSCVRLQQSGHAVTPMEVFQYPTVFSLAAFLDERSAPAAQAPAAQAVKNAADSRSQKQREALMRNRQMRRDRQPGSAEV
jgi:aryl carrier-like protein